MSNLRISNRFGRKGFAFLATFAVIGIATLTFSLASTPSNGVAHEAEAGLLSGAAGVATGDGASGGGYATLNSATRVSGELKRWHPVTIDFNGPATDESATPNPFSDYVLNVTFTNGSNTYTVPGFFAADGDAAETSANGGSRWRVIFSPDLEGTWNYSVSFKTGSDVAVTGGGTSAGFMDGQAGAITVAASDKTGVDNRARGRLEYVGEHYLQYAQTKDYLIKFGADSPENTLAYNDFDSTPNAGNKRKDWSPHAGDYIAGEAERFTWKSGNGSELLGAVNYLSGQGMNAFSFLTFSLDGDDDNVYPHLAKSDNATSWNDVHHDRFDVSKMAQWDRIFSYADTKGMYLHFKTMETENDNLMDGNSMGRERKLYYRELIARFGYHLALNWNISEEETLSDATVKEVASFIDATDPYDNHIVIHTYPNDHDKYQAFIGNGSKLTGASIQTDINSVHSVVAEWVQKSSATGRKWVVANDEQGSANVGVDKDPAAQDLVRSKVIWGSLMAGGGGAEFYYGYQTGCTDLTCQDHRTRATKWVDAKHAIDFFRGHLPYWEMVSADSLTADGGDYVFAKPGAAYAVYLPSGGSPTLNLSGVSGEFSVQWFNPRAGGALQNGSIASVSGGGQRSLGTAPATPTQDWVVLVKLL